MTVKPYYTLHPALQFLYFILIFLGIYFAGNVIGIALISGLYGFEILNDIARYNLGSANAHNALWILQLLGTTLPIFIAPVFFAYVIVRDPDDYIKPHFEFSWKLLVIAFVVMLLSFPLIEVLGNFNQNLDVSGWLPGLQHWLKETEQSAEKITEAMLQMHNPGNLIAVVLFVGLLTAIVEEFMFRGVMQTILFRWTKNIHAAIWITAFLFSAFHMEFFGFLPRMFLGVLFGYFVAWSGSVWTSVWAHFINNAVDVLLTYLSQHKLIGINPDNPHVFNLWAYIISLIFTLFLLFAYRYVALKSLRPVTE